LSPALESNIFRVIIVHKFLLKFATAKLQKIFDYPNSFSEIRLQCQFVNKNILMFIFFKSPLI